MKFVVGSTMPTATTNQQQQQIWAGPSFLKVHNKYVSSQVKESEKILSEVLSTNLQNYIENQIIQNSNALNLKQRIEEDIRNKQRLARENSVKAPAGGVLTRLFTRDAEQSKHNRFGIFVPTNVTLREAAKLWHEDRTSCISEYGHPCVWDTWKVTDVSGWFEAGSEYSVPGSWDLSNVPILKATNESLRIALELWGKNKSAATIKYGPIEMWNTSQVTDMSNLFKGQFNDYIGSWNVSQVTNMSRMFLDAYKFNQPLSDWDVSRVTNMAEMFKGATKWNSSLSKWDVSQVTNMESMFYQCSSFNQPLSDWDVSKVTSMKTMFYRASSFNQPLSEWDVSHVTDLSWMFRDASTFNQSLSYWNVRQVRNMSHMFSYASAFNQPLSDWDVSHVTDMSNMFSNATSFNQPLSAWDVSRVTNMISMFAYATSFNQPLSDWDVSKVTTMMSMFCFATSFNQSLSDWDVCNGRGVQMYQMFYGASSFNQSKLAPWCK